jgi:hypothetical protein
VPLQTGIWSVNANGFEGELNIVDVDAQGHVTGRIFGDVFQGFWTETSQRITFTRNPSSRNAEDIQVYTAFLFRTSRIPKFTLAGYFEAFEGTGGTSQRNVFGWVAEVTEIPG